LETAALPIELLAFRLPPPNIGGSTLARLLQFMQQPRTLICFKF
jgi:hypothetical protein